MSIIGLLIAVILLGLIYWAITRLSAAFGIPEPIRTVILVVLVVITVLWIVGQISGYGPPLKLR